MDVLRLNGRVKRLSTLELSRYQGVASTTSPSYLREMSAAEVAALVASLQEADRLMLLDHFSLDLGGIPRKSVFSTLKSAVTQIS